MNVSRRKLIKQGLPILPAMVINPGLVLKTMAESLVADHDNRTLIIIQMAGGNDGLNTVIPYTDGRYYDYRPSLAIPRSDVTPLNGEVGLHPSLARFKDFWDEGLLAIVEGVGYPKPNFSHFTSMDIWRRGGPEIKQPDGWLGRYLSNLDNDQRSIFSGLAIGRSLPGELYSPEVAIPIVTSIGAYQFQGNPVYRSSNDIRKEILLHLYNASPTDGVYSHLFDTTARVANESTQALQAAAAAYQSDITYPDNRFAADLKLIAQIIIADLGLRVGHVKIGGFDTHANQLDTHSQLLSTLAEGLAAFYTDLKVHNRDQDVLIMTWSEFGRRVNSNASAGTDHGSAGPVFLIGAHIKGGLYGKQPDLGNLDKNNLRYTTDFRYIYATVLEKWFGSPSASVIDGRFDSLPFL